MSTNENQRITRSVSKARSEGTPSANVSMRGRRGRRGGTPARDEEVKKPTVIAKTSKAYGADGRVANAAQLSTARAMNSGIDPIASAVANAEAFDRRMPALVEEEEDSDEYAGPGNEQEDLDDDMSIGPDNPSGFLSFWAPRGGFGPLDHHRDDRPPLDPDDTYWYNHPFWQILFFLIMSVMGIATTMAAIDHAFNPAQMPKPTAELISGRFSLINHRLEKFEQALQELSLVSDSGSHVINQHRVNWFEPGNGAQIDLQLSSPTYARFGRSDSFLDFIASFLPLNSGPAQSDGPFRGEPMEALMPWTDGGLDRWCAPPSRGKLQLTVINEHAVAPTELVVENIAKDATLRVGMAPKEVELWVQILDDGIRAGLIEAMERMHPELLEVSSPQNGKELDPRVALGPEFVPVGRWIYNIWTNQEIQVFKVPIPLREYNVRSKKIAIRVNSNWGDLDRTCINRFRLYGHDMSGYVEYLEQDPATIK